MIEKFYLRLEKVSWVALFDTTFLKILPMDVKKLLKCSAMPFWSVTGFWFISKDDELFVLPAFFE